jgi:ketosteroid isomerase-like protein
VELSEARDLFQRSYDAWSRADADALIPLYDPECEWDNTRVPIDPTLYRGHDGLRTAVALWFESWDEFRVEMRELSQLGEDRFLIKAAGTGVGRDSGVPVALPPLLQIITTRAGRILAVRNYLDLDEALAAASAEEP